MTRAEKLIFVAQLFGCEVDSVQHVDVHGETYAAIVVRARDNAHAIELLNGLAWDAADGRYTKEPDADVGAIGEMFRVKWNKRAALEGLAPSPELLARDLHAYVKETIAFVDETGEKFRSPSLTMRLGCGDCDDHAGLLVALGTAAGLGARAVPVENTAGQIVHVAAQLQHDGDWHWAETTFAAEYGAEPRAEAKRLGILRDDVAG